MRRMRSIRPGQVPVWVASGRWGPRRARVNECWAVTQAENVYTQLLARDAARTVPGACGSAKMKLEGRELDFDWEVRQNAVWRAGRVFLLCDRCSRRCTRLYAPTRESWLACRRCWGLTYGSQTLGNYKNGLAARGAFARMFGWTQRDCAFDATIERRQKRLAASHARWAERRRNLPTSMPAKGPGSSAKISL